MLIYLLRHGLTEYNAQKRYQGQRDIPLSPEGLAQLRRADIDPKVVYISTLQRTRQTAEVLFPDAELVPVDGLKEMCFGSFEGRNYIEMEHDPDYQAWVAANCESSCPDGERKDDFSERVCRTFAALVDKALADGEEMPEQIGYINAHGTSTHLNDSCETTAIKTVFGGHAYKLAVSSTKSMTGHLLGGAGGVEGVFTALALRDAFLPATVNLQEPDPELDLDYIPNHGRAAQVEYAMSDSLGFGGHNACVVFKRWEE